MSYNILPYTGELRENSGFSRKSAYISHHAVIHLSEERAWRELAQETLEDERNSVAGSVHAILQKKSNKRTSAQIIPFQKAG